ncbi:ZIP family metal transporter [Robiginitomaculum antarcticum]|uniref:ZIP family metal transporter n=1 Tax=Robiginitomaculum antarcticum TaxID=437507 RepID=UPI0003691C25|nr:hypothetical protein [Robiginitomaculum antarcticum]
MLTVLIVSVIVSLALIIGAVIGLSRWFNDKASGFLLALAGGALIYAVTAELIMPSIEIASLWPVVIAVMLGGIVFTGVNHRIDKKTDNPDGLGLVAAVTLDGVPENIALGVALISAGPMAVTALAGSIFLSNLPEAAGAAQEMKKAGRSKKSILTIWSGTACLLIAAAVLGNLAFAHVQDVTLSYIQAFTAGTVIASLATEIFPSAYKNTRHMAGIAVTLGLVLAICLQEISH